MSLFPVGHSLPAMLPVMLEWLTPIRRRGRSKVPPRELALAGGVAHTPQASSPARFASDDKATITRRSVVELFETFCAVLGIGEVLDSEAEISEEAIRRLGKALKIVGSQVLSVYEKAWDTLPAPAAKGDAR